MLKETRTVLAPERMVQRGRDHRESGATEMFCISVQMCITLLYPFINSLICVMEIWALHCIYIKPHFLKKAKYANVLHSSVLPADVFTV